MKMSSFLATVGVGMLAGAATMLMLPKHSQAYRMADDAAHAIKQEAGKMFDSMRMS